MDNSRKEGWKARVVADPFSRKCPKCGGPMNVFEARGEGKVLFHLLPCEKCKVGGDPVWLIK